MIITNKTGRILKLKNAKTGKLVMLAPGKRSYEGVSAKDPAYSFRLVALREAGMIDFSELVEKEKDKPIVKAVMNVRDVTPTIEKTVRDGNADSSDGSVSGQKADKSK